MPIAPEALMALAGGLLQQSGPSRMPQSFGQRLGGAMAPMLQMQQLAQQNARQGRLDQMRMAELAMTMQDRRQQQAAQQREQQAAQAAQAARQQYIGGLPPEQQALAAAYPEKFGAQAAQAQFRAPPNPAEQYRTVGTDLYRIGPQGPELAARGRRASEPLVPVYDQATGQTIYQPRGQAAGQMAPPKSGMEITTGPDGQTIVRTNVQGGQTELGTKSRNTIEDQMIAMTGARERLGNIAAAWQPEFSTLQTRVGMWGKELRDKVGLLPPEQQGELAAYSDYQQNTLSNLNRTIKDITGAAMSIPEAARIMKEVPNLEDSPTKFKAKLDNALKLTNLSYARLNYIRNNGLPQENFGGIALDDIPSIMDKKGAEYEQQLVSQGFDPAVAEQQAMAQVRQEFGL